MNSGDDSRQPTNKRAKVGEDGLTKHQRYYRRNADRLKKESAERQRQLRQQSIATSQCNPVTVTAGSCLNDGSRGHHSRHDKAIQTDTPDNLNASQRWIELRPTVQASDILHHLEEMINSYTKSALRHLYKDLGNLEGKAQRGLLELRQRVSNWSSVAGGYLMWNETIELQVQAAGRENLSALENLFGVLLVRKMAGQDLLCQLHGLGSEDIAPSECETLVAVRSRLHLISVVSLGLGVTEVWMLIIKRQILEGSGLYNDEESVVNQLLPSVDGMD